MRLMGWSGYVGEHLAQIRPRVDAVSLRRADQTVDRRRPFPSRVRAGKQIVLPSDRDRAERPFSGAVVDLHAAILGIGKAGQA